MWKRTGAIAAVVGVLALGAWFGGKAWSSDKATPLVCAGTPHFRAAWDYATDAEGHVKGDATPEAAIQALSNVRGFGPPELVTALRSSTGKDRVELSDDSTDSVTGVVFIEDRAVHAYHLNRQPDGSWIVASEEAC
jgi:hypothetical protein